MLIFTLKYFITESTTRTTAFVKAKHPNRVFE